MILTNKVEQDIILIVTLFVWYMATMLDWVKQVKWIVLLVTVTLGLCSGLCTFESQSSHKCDEFAYKFILNISDVFHMSSERFLSFSIDSHDIRKGLRRPSLRNSTLIRLLSYLSPGYLRIGGTEADRLVFKEENAISHPHLPINPNNTFTLSEKQWMEICKFAKVTGLKVLFDLNVLLRKGFNWDFTNAKQLLDFSAKKGIDVDWQLGNEPNSFLHTFNLTVSPSQLAKDFMVLRELLDSYPVFSKALLVGPDVTTPRPYFPELLSSMPAQRFLYKFAVAGGTAAVDAVAWHHYYLHSNAAAADFLSPVVFDSLEKSIASVRQAVAGAGKHLWITESGSASGGGVAAVTDRFVSSFLFLDKLGLAAREGVHVIVRQSLFSGKYGLVDSKTLSPNPDWWVSYIYKKLVTPAVLSIVPVSRVPGTLRVYAHCSSNGTVIMFGMNLSNSTEQLVVGPPYAPYIAQFYALTAPSLLSRRVLLNGELLRIQNDVAPPLHSVTVDVQSPLHIAAHSIFFLHFNHLYSYQCHSVGL